MIAIAIAMPLSIWAIAWMIVRLSESDNTAEQSRSDWFTSITTTQSGVRHCVIATPTKTPGYTDHSCDLDVPCDEDDCEFDHVFVTWDKT